VRLKNAEAFRKSKLRNTAKNENPSSGYFKKTLIVSLKKRILIASWTIPENKMGGGLLLHRHFVLRSDFEIGIVTPNPAQSAPVFHRFIQEPTWLERLKRTRFAKWFHDYTHLIYARQFNVQLLAAAREFQPDLIFNVAETWVSFHALKLARRLKIPFACYFMDWAHYSAYCHKWAVPLMNRMYRQLYRESDVTFCISDGMREELGSHLNARVLYPTPSVAVEKMGATIGVEYERRPNNHEKFHFLFAGNLAHWYGRQVAAVLEMLQNESILSLKVFGSYHAWSPEFVKAQRDCGAYLGFKPYEELIPEFQNADCFFLPMGFDPGAALIERTSFKTKFLDYLSFEKPILIWGPEYCTAIRAAREYDAAYCVTDPNPAAVIHAMREIAQRQELRGRLCSGAYKAKLDKFNNESVYAVLKSGLESLWR
jgi:glycosyltransferase involved in cell wall biosynthesis